jgi:hypothetical protein
MMKKMDTEASLELISRNILKINGGGWMSQLTGSKLGPAGVLLLQQQQRGGGGGRV